MNTLELDNVSIVYRVGGFKDIGLKDYVIQKIKGTYDCRDFYADRNISFSLQLGDMLGIIGSNGAGKSTLLKAISGIMRPSEGKININGVVVALLELGTGFDDELTVKENTFLRGALLGYTRKFMNERYRDIIDFAELEDFENRPFKYLSSGMKSRLAFSIASFVQPDILILDEVMAVGDGGFRRKSEDKTREIIAGGATTILVSHDQNQIREMCTKILWLDKGHQVAFTDDVQGAVNDYEEFLESGNIEKYAEKYGGKTGGQY
ncbi:MAG: ABC transporter ATP-binding protein [Parasporobacterium sp.]|nr:ABC transporter ATP-binding protein [Parasporobacterium sp.]